MKVQDLAEFVSQCPPTGRILLSRKAFDEMRFTPGDWFDVGMEAVKCELTPAETKPEVRCDGATEAPLIEHEVQFTPSDSWTTPLGDETQGQHGHYQV